MRVCLSIDRDSRHGKDISSENISLEANPKEEVLLAELRNRYDLQQAEIETANTKIGLVLAYLGAVFFLLPGIFTDIAPKIQRGNGAVLWLSVAAFLVYLASAGCCILAIRPARSYSPVAIERDEIETYLALTREEMILQILAQYSHFIQQNFKVVQSKNQWLIRSLLLSLIFISSLIGVKGAILLSP